MDTVTQSRCVCPVKDTGSHIRDCHAGEPPYIASVRFRNHADEIDYLLQRGRFAPRPTPKLSFATVGRDAQRKVLTKAIHLGDHVSTGRAGRRWPCTEDTFSGYSMVREERERLKAAMERLIDYASGVRS